MEIKEDFALAYYNKGIAYRTLKGEDNSRKALEMFELAIKYQNDYLSAYFNKGCILIELGEDIEAIHVFNKCKELEQEINLGKKKNEEIKKFYNQELLEKNMENVIKTENEEELVKKIEGMQIMIEGLKKEKDEYKKKDIENQIKIKNLNMNINEKIENIMMQNEEIEWFIREYNKLNMNYLDTKKDLSNIENLLLTKMKEKEKKKENKKEEETKKTDSKEDEKTEDKEDKNDSENSFLEDMFQMK